LAALDDALLGLEQALDIPRRHQMWRWLVRHRMAGVKDALTGAADLNAAGLTARDQTLGRERATLLRRLSELGPLVLEAPDVEPVRRDLLRLVGDLEHHRQRLNDLVYDTVSLELGGSE
jgi:hypothetical protein